MVIIEERIYKMQDCCEVLTERLTKAAHEEIMQLVALGYDRFRALNHNKIIPAHNELFSCKFESGRNHILRAGKSEKYTVEFFGEHAKMGPVARVYVNNGQMVTIWEVEIVGLPNAPLKQGVSNIAYGNPICMGINPV